MGHIVVPNPELLASGTQTAYFAPRRKHDTTYNDDGRTVAVFNSRSMNRGARRWGLATQYQVQSPSSDGKGKQGVWVNKGGGELVQGNIGTFNLTDPRGARHAQINGFRPLMVVVTEIVSQDVRYLGEEDAQQLGYTCLGALWAAWCAKHNRNTAVIHTGNGVWHGLLKSDPQESLWVNLPALFAKSSHWSWQAWLLKIERVL